jgi:hypothetical protein
MPAISVDTFLACSLMVMLVLSAMAGTSKVLYPYIHRADDENLAERYLELSKYLLLNSGTPSDWGQNGNVIPSTFGLAKASSDNPFELDTDKVSRLNSENLQSLTYAQIFTISKIPDISFKMQIKPIFKVNIDLVSTFALANQTVYQFEILTEKNGLPVTADLAEYVIAEHYIESSSTYAPEGRAYVNLSLSNSINGPALFVVLARSAYDAKIASFNAYAFAHNSADPKSRGAFLRQSPVNYTLNVSALHSDTVLSEVYALSFNYNLTLIQVAGNGQTVTYNLPHFLDSSPTLIIATGRNATSFFAEWTAYPQIPLEVGANFAATSLSNVFTHVYTVTINSVNYECTVWVGGPR